MSSLPPPSSLPLGWTRIGRNRKRDRTTTATTKSNGPVLVESSSSLKVQKQGQEEEQPPGWTGKKQRGAVVRPNEKDFNDGVDDEYIDFRCCNNRRKCPHRLQKLTNNTANDTGSPPKLRRCYRGRVIFCMLETDPYWFQGYFFPSSSISNKSIVGGTSHLRPKPWRLLATQREVEGCLACAEGGYRLVDLTVHCNGQKEVLDNIEWTGGDMMELLSPHLSMRTERLATGTVGAQMAQQVFPTMIQQARKQLITEMDKMPDVSKEEQENMDSCKENKKQNDPEAEEENVLGFFPDIAIVAGSMQVYVPIHNKEYEQELLENLMFADH